MVELISRCHAFLRFRPNHVYAHWYLGRAYFMQEQWSEAREAFETLKRISPDWSDSVESYLDDIGEKGG